MDALRRVREGRGLTQAELARRIQRSAPFIAQLEGGTRGASIETLRRLALVLHTSVDALIGESPPAPVKSRAGSPSAS